MSEQFLHFDDGWNVAICDAPTWNPALTKDETKTTCPRCIVKLEEQGRLDEIQLFITECTSIGTKYSMDELVAWFHRLAERHYSA